MSSPSSGISLYFRLLSYVRPHWRTFAVSLVAMAGAAATEPLFPAMLKPLLDSNFANADAYPIWYFPLAIIGIFLLRGILGFVASYGMTWVSVRVITDARNALFDRLMFLPVAFFENQSTARLASRVAYDVSGLADAATTALTVVVRDTLTVIGLLAWIFYLNWKLALVTLIVFPAIGIAIRFSSRRMRLLSGNALESMGAINQVLDEAISGHKVVKVFGGQSYEIERFRQVTDMLRGLGMRLSITSGLISPFVQMMASIALAIVVYVALLQAREAQTTVGGFVSFITAMLMLLPSLRRLTDVSSILQRGLASAESIFGLLDEVEERDTGARTLGRAVGRVEFERVGFRYDGAERDALGDIDILIEPGRTVALVGGSGGGKTTLANLLPRFHLPAAGRILLDGIDIADLKLADLRANIALVSQDIVLFNDTVAANIAYGTTRGAAAAAIETAARAAHAHDFIMQMPDGYATLIGENGVKLSGGQRQRLAIARAILKDAPVLILDEATSALDSESERQVQAALEALMQNRTTLVIAHRLSTVERADTIVVLQSGRIVERGTHPELLAAGGLYAQLYRMQFAEPAEGKPA